MISLREAVDRWEKWKWIRKDDDALLADAARSLLSIREAAVYENRCTVHGRPVASGHHPRVPCDGRVDHRQPSNCNIVPVAVVPAGLIGGETE